ncbi:hypothetical protein PTSG_12448 [Salpingoeca rosetta]|uniref:Secreted protein n=1 Tax=Salpingoeca rosetta (strain ATCC 50818 / BSB-021) TaxID=946362 RepID=F2UFZ8_SALR5|nr:uncharacterized protein PTSG_12448 [Salpingoeca rosetta]EGD75426.1 hypothetical protein PTSG_12448 [Salpingoeca rosetta]|eukprot:XP_004991883.1 hypothetical protein PTSG_12448 [Salpingoeca rosetta]
MSCVHVCAFMATCWCWCERLCIHTFAVAVCVTCASYCCCHLLLCWRDLSCPILDALYLQQCTHSCTYTYPCALSVVHFPSPLPPFPPFPPQDLRCCVIDCLAQN